MTALTLRFADRPYTSPCVLCPNDIPLDQTVSLETESGQTESGQTVCDDCAKAIDPRQHAALAVLRAVDAGWWELARGLDPESVAAAGEYLRHVASGVAMLAEFYAPAEVTP